MLAGMARRIYQSEVCAVSVEISSALFNLVILQYYQQSASSAEKQKSWALPIRFVNEYVDHKEYVELSQACLTDERIRIVRWMAPESFLDGVWDLRSDVWMFGVLLWGLLDCISIVAVIV